jgi:hypothetical protein
MRIDVMEALKGLKPSFLRMPGGNNLSVLTNMYLSLLTVKGREIMRPIAGNGMRPLVP